MPLSIKTQAFLRNFTMGLFLGLVLMFLLLTKFCNPPSKPELIYKTDTIKVPVELIIYDTVILPKEVVKPRYVYLTETRHTFKTDTIYSFLPQTKIVYTNGGQFFRYSRFLKDTLHLITWDTTGAFSKYSFPTNYDKYGYELSLSTGYPVLEKFDLQKESISQNKRPFLSSLRHESNAYLMYSPLHNGARFQIDYSVQYKKWGAFAMGSLQTYKPYSDLGIGIKYSIR